MKKLLIYSAVLIFIGISNQGFGQTMDEFKRITQVRYQRALKYNDRVEAKSALYTLTSLEPQNDTLMANLAYLYFEARQYASTVLICQDVLAINPDNPGGLEMSAISYENLGLFDKALDHYEKLYLISDDDPQILYKMTFIQYDDGSYEQCMTNIDILMGREETKEMKAYYNIEGEEKEYPAEVALLNLKGMVYKEQGNLEEARKNYEAALALAPDFIFAKENLAALDSNE